MRLLSTVRDILSLETLDSRFTVGTQQSPSTPRYRAAPSLATSSRSSERSPHADESRESKRVREEAGPSRWKTPEFWLYYLVFALAIPAMFKCAYDLSRESHPNYPKYQHLLSPGWIAGRKVDNSDRQFRSFRSNMPILFSVLGLHFILRRLFNFFFCAVSPQPPVTSTYRASHNITRRNIFDIVFALIFLSALHSFSVIKIVVILTGNYLISFFHPTSVANPILTWVFNVGVLFANEYCEGYSFATIFSWLIAGEGAGVGHAMDKAMNGGLLPRWNVNFNITILRLISYNLDHYWAAKNREQGDRAASEGGTVLEVRDLERKSDEEARVGVTGEATAEAEMEAEAEVEAEVEAETRLIAEQKKKQLDPANISETDRVEGPARYEDYGFLSYMAYALYSPLYLAGPIITFNDFVHQQRYPSAAIGPTRLVLKYAFRLGLTILCMEVILHYTYVVAISKTASSGSWLHDSPGQLSMIGYFNLHIIWLKLLIPWRFFRLWSLLDGVDPPENMLRCMSNNYSASAFWRAWHRSFNRWILRYIYIPLGGSRRPIVGMVVAFTFVALWHDLSFKLLAWGWMVVLFILPETIARKLFPAKRFVGRETLYRNLCAVGSVANVLMMMAANLVGFAIGVEGLRDLIHGVLGSFEGVAFMATACFCIFVGVQVMFEVREGEKRMGVNLKC